MDELRHKSHVTWLIHSWKDSTRLRELKTWLSHVSSPSWHDESTRDSWRDSFMCGEKTVKDCNIWTYVENCILWKYNVFTHIGDHYWSSPWFFNKHHYVSHTRGWVTSRVSRDMTNPHVKRLRHVTWYDLVMSPGVCTYICVQIYVYVCVCVYICMCMCMYIYICIYMYIYVYMCMCIYMYV